MSVKPTPSADGSPARRCAATRPSWSNSSPVERCRCCGCCRLALTPREIAKELYLSPNTIKTHTRGIYRKLGVNTRHEAVEAARRVNLL